MQCSWIFQVLTMLRFWMWAFESSLIAACLQSVQPLTDSLQQQAYAPVKRVIGRSLIIWGLMGRTTSQNTLPLGSSVCQALLRFQPAIQSSWRWTNRKPVIVSHKVFTRGLPQTQSDDMLRLLHSRCSVINSLLTDIQRSQTDTFHRKISPSGTHNFSLISKEVKQDLVRNKFFSGTLNLLWIACLFLYRPLFELEPCFHSHRGLSLAFGGPLVASDANAGSRYNECFILAEALNMTTLGIPLWIIQRAADQWVFAPNKPPNLSKERVRGAS